jgi:ornithine cyclodeaminase/alanine dehydrogenase-like protein (mu-crystallin family)
MRILSEEDLKKALSMKETIDVNREAFVSLSSGEAQVRTSNCRTWTLKSLTLHFTPIGPSKIHI